MLHELLPLFKAFTQEPSDGTDKHLMLKFQTDTASLSRPHCMLAAAGDGKDIQTESGTPKTRNCMILGTSIFWWDFTSMAP